MKKINKAIKAVTRSNGQTLNIGDSLTWKGENVKATIIGFSTYQDEHIYVHTELGVHTLNQPDMIKAL